MYELTKRVKDVEASRSRARTRKGWCVGTRGQMSVSFHCFFFTGALSHLSIMYMPYYYYLGRYGGREAIIVMDAIPRW